MEPRQEIGRTIPFAWSIDVILNPERTKRLKALTMHRWDGSHPCCGLCDATPRTILAGIHLAGDPGRERDAELAWATELKVFGRGTGEPPVVKSYRDGVYTVVGLITTTHPADHHPGTDGIVWFT